MELSKTLADLDSTERHDFFGIVRLVDTVHLPRMDELTGKAQDASNHIDNLTIGEVLAAAEATINDDGPNRQAIWMLRQLEDAVVQSGWSN